MKKIVLLVGIFACFAYESSAETWNCGPATDGVYSDSVKCTYDEASKTLTVSGEGKMGDYDNVEEGNLATTPWINKDITTVVIENGVSAIGNYAFQNCGSLASVKLADSLQIIGRYAFNGCDNLESIDLPDGVIMIGDRAFRGTGLTEVTIPRTVTDIGERAFVTCSNLKTATIEGTQTQIGDYAFGFYRTTEDEYVMVDGFELRSHGTDCTAKQYADKYGVHYLNLDE